MRVLPVVLAFFPTFVLADEIMLTSQISDVTLYPQGAKIVRRVPFEAAAGRHDLQLIDLPQGTPMETVRVSLEGASMGAVKLRDDYVPPVADRESDELKAARENVERLEEAMRAKADEAQAIRAAGEAADTRIQFLRQLSEGQALNGVGADDLRNISRMVGEETLAARQAALSAEGQARAVDREVKELAKALDKARQAVQALAPEGEARNLVQVSVSSDAAMQGVLEISYYDWRASWSPVYDAYLDREAATVTLKRGALVRQNTGENWANVAVTMSTNAPEGAVAPETLWPDFRRIVDPAEVQPTARMKRSDSAVLGAMVEPAMESPVMVEEATANFDGLSVSYDYPGTLALASSADTVRLELGELSFDAEIKAVAVPKRDRTAFLVAEFTNTSGELILPSTLTQLFRDGDFVGEFGNGEPIAAGGEASLPFGPIEGLQLSRVNERNEGDRGVLSRSNEITENVVIKVENLTGESWPLRVLDQVPYSEQEDLVITWNAQPRPSQVDVDDQKGVLAWESEIAAGETFEINLNYSLQWPDGKILR